MASTYVAGGDLEYGRYGNPTWAAFETALGALEGGRCLAYASGMAAVTSLLDLVALGDKVVVPRHSYNGTLVSLADLELRGRLTTTARRPHGHRGGGRGVRGRRAGLVRVADQPGPRGGRRPRDHRGGARRRRPRGRRQHVPHPAAAAASRARRRRGAALGDQVPRRPQRRTARARSSPATTISTPCSRGGATSRATRPGRSRPGSRCAACARCTCASSAPRPTPPSSPAALPTTRCSPRSATPASARWSRSSCPPPTTRTCWCAPPRSGCTPPAWAASSRRSSAAVAGSPSPRPSPRAWSGSRSASRTSRTCGPTSAGRWTGSP